MALDRLETAAPGDARVWRTCSPGSGSPAANSSRAANGSGRSSAVTILSAESERSCSSTSPITTSGWARSTARLPPHGRRSLSRRRPATGEPSGTHCDISASSRCTAAIWTKGRESSRGYSRRPATMWGCDRSHWEIWQSSTWRPAGRRSLVGSSVRPATAFARRETRPTKPSRASTLRFSSSTAATSKPLLRSPPRCSRRTGRSETTTGASGASTHSASRTSGWVVAARRGTRLPKRSSSCWQRE